MNWDQSKFSGPYNKMFLTARINWINAQLFHIGLHQVDLYKNSIYSGDMPETSQLITFNCFYNVLKFSALLLHVLFPYFHLFLVSVISFALIFWLLYSEINYYLHSKFIFKFSPDIDYDERLKINIDITVAMPCAGKFISFLVIFYELKRF